MSDREVKRLTPKSIANLIMADEAWHDSLYVKAEDYDSLLADFEALRTALAAPEPEPGLEFMENSLSIRLQINRGKRALGVQRFVSIKDIERHPQIVFLEVDNAWKMLKKAQEDKP